MPSIVQPARVSAGINIVGAVPCSPEVISISKELRPDVVILGPRLDGDPGEYFILIRRLFPVRAVILLDACTRELVVEAFRAGASGVLSRDESV
jgi:DNA-binding NarL/FixJ family response regulator